MATKLTPDAAELEQLLAQVGQLLIKYVDRASTNDGGARALNIDNALRPSDCAASILQRHLLHGLGDSNGDETRQGLGVSGVVRLVGRILDASVCTWSPHFLDKLYSGVHPIGAVSELVCAVLNNNVHVFRASPVLSTMEVEMTRMFARMFGYEQATAGGVLCPGGSYSNLLAMTTARNHLLPELRECGTDGKCDPANRRFRYAHATGPLTVFASVQSHFSIVQSAVILGIGSRNVIAVPSDSRGCMDTNALKRLVQQSVTDGCRPFLVVATAGTTVLGAFDNLNQCADVAQEFGLWLHVDGSWGGGVVFSDNDTVRQRIAGAHRADSVVFNPHKVMSCPLLCSVLILQDIGRLQANSTEASYLFHGHDDDDEYHAGVSQPQITNWDLGKGTLGCGRRADILKLYLTWVFYGRTSVARSIDQSMELAQWLVQVIKDPAGYGMPELCGHLELAHESVQYMNVCFFFYRRVYNQVPTDYFGRLRSADPQRWHDEVDATTKSMHRRLLERGSFMLDYAPIVDCTANVRLPASWRVVTQHRLLSQDVLRDLLRELYAISLELTPHNTLN